MMISQRVIRLSGALLATLCGSNVLAADETWEHQAAVYMVGASIDGTVGIGPVEADINVGFDEILDNLELGFMGAYRGKRGPWAVSADLIYMALEGDKSGLGITGNGRAAADFDETIFEVSAAYDLNNVLAAYAGLRYWNLDGDVEVTLGGPGGTVLTAGGGDDWVDPIVGLRLQLPLGDSWQFVVKGDVGGFGVGSDFAWQSTAYFAWQPGAHGNLLLGYRYLYNDYEAGSGSDRFRWDVGQGGPTAGFGWRF